MKIGFYINEIGGGGAERVVVNLANQFSEHQCKVVLITTLRSEMEYQLDKPVKRYNLEEAEMKGRIKRNILRISKIRKIVKKEKLDIIISFLAEPNYRAILATMGLKTKILISVRNDPNREYAGRVGKFLGQHLLPLADGCVFQTPEAQAWFPKKLQKKSMIIPNAVNEEFFHIERNPIPGLVVTCGRLTEQKNHKLLIKAFSQVASNFPDAVLHIYGEGELKQQLKSIIELSPFSNRIKLMGATDHVPEVMATADVFVLSSDYEGMPNALMEALAAGVACISTDCPCGGSRMLIQSNENGFLVPVDDCKAMTDALRKVLFNKELKNNISESGKKHALSFEPKKIFRLWNMYISKIANG